MTPGTNGGRLAHVACARQHPASIATKQHAALVPAEERSHLPSAVCALAAPALIALEAWLMPSHALAMGGQSIHPCPRHLPKHEITTTNVLFASPNGDQLQRLLLVRASDAPCSHLFAHSHRLASLCPPPRGAAGSPVNPTCQPPISARERRPPLPCPAFISAGGKVEPPRVLWLLE